MLFTAFMSDVHSSYVLSYPKLILTAPLGEVPSSLCASGAHCNPGRVMILYLLSRMVATSLEGMFLILKDSIGIFF